MQEAENISYSIRLTVLTEVAAAMMVVVATRQEYNTTMTQ
jgi:hypothetical protein